MPYRGCASTRGTVMVLWVPGMLLVSLLLPLVLGTSLSQHHLVALLSLHPLPSHVLFCPFPSVAPPPASPPAHPVPLSPRCDHLVPLLSGLCLLLVPSPSYPCPIPIPATIPPPSLYPHPLHVPMWSCAVPTQGPWPWPAESPRP